MFTRLIPALLLVALAVGCGPALPRGEDPADFGPSQEIPRADPTLPTASELLTAHIEATGVDSVIGASSSVVLRGRARYEELDLEGTFEAVRARPARSMMTLWLPTVGAMVSGCNGELGWVEHPVVGVKSLDGVTLAKARINASYDHLLRRPEGLETYVTVGRTKFAGQDCYEVFGLYSLPAGLEAPVTERSFREYYDVGTGLLVGLVERSESTAGSVEVESVFRDYELLGPSLVATSTRQRSNGFTLLLQVEEVIYDVPVDDLFVLPDEIQVLVDG